MKEKDLWIDADHILYLITGTKRLADGSLEGEDLTPSNQQVPTKAFEDILAGYWDAFQIESVMHSWRPGSMNVVLSDSEHNFRNKIFPDYKANRAEVTLENFHELRAWARKKFIVEKGVEADDVLGYYVRKGGVGVTTDKDLYKGVKGLWYDAYHKEWVKTSKKEGLHFFMLQTLAGDNTDGIPGLPRVGLITAEKLLGDGGWDRVLEIYEEKGFTYDDMLLTKRLVSMRQWHPKKGVRLEK